MDHRAPADRSVLDAAPDLAMDEEALQALETDVRLATHLRALSRVSIATAHDVRTPLHTIVLYLELLRNTLAEAPVPDRQTRQERYIEVVASELGRLEVMLDNLLGQMRLGEGQVQRADIVGTVKEVLEFLEPQRRRTRIEIAWDGAEDPVFVEIDRDAIRHALTHILVIAIETTPEGETLRVQVATGDGRAAIRIQGTGSFGDRMRQDPKDENGTQRLVGTERGLEVARRVVERHRGIIYTRSGASRAATLEIDLPLSAAEDK